MVKSDKRQILFIVLCFFAYFSVYSARYSYTANYNPIIGEYGVPRAEVGLVSTFFFFAYAIFLVINGFFCKRYPKHFVVPIAMFASSACTISLFLGVPFKAYKWIWMLNGISQSFMWPTLIQSLGECIEDKNVGKSTLAMSSTASLGILLSTGLSALFTAINQYKLIFLVCAVLMSTVAIVWLVTFKFLYEKRKEEKKTEREPKTKRKLTSAVLLPLIMLVLFAIITNLIYDGLRPWTPVLIKETFNFSDSKSVMLTILLPIVTFAVLFLNQFLFKWLKDLIVMNGFWFTIVAGLIALTIPLLKTNCWWGVTALLALSVGFVGCINNVITSMAPMHFRNSIAPGILVGVLDGFCYVGSTVSTYTLGLLRDNASWQIVLTVLSVACATIALLCPVYLIIRKRFNKKMNKKIKAIVFDLDGTLLNTLPDLHNSVNYALDKFGLPLRSESEVRSYLGNGLKALAERALPEDKKELLEEFFPVLKAYYDEHKNDETAPYDKVKEMLSAVKEQGYKTAIVSNKYDEAVQELKEQTFTGTIDFALGEKSGIPAKPAPDGVWYAIERLKVERDECVYVGDSEVDLLTAKNAGLRCVAVSWGFRDKDFLIEKGATSIIDEPMALIDELSRL